MANKYINAAATGAGDGSSWADAWTAIQDVTWTRGNTYYVASGTYTIPGDGRENVFIAESGSLYITLKKANAADNSGDAGWDAAFASGQAVIEGRMGFQYGYIEIDGVTGSGNSGHGFKFYNDIGTDSPLLFSAASGSTNIKIYHSEICRDTAFSDTGVDGIFDNTGTTAKKLVHIAYCWIHDVSRNACNFTNLTGTSYTDYGMLFENNFVSETGGALNLDHGQGIQIQTDSSYLIFRNNTFRNVSGTACIAFLGVAKTYEYVRFYNNVFYKDDEATYPNTSPAAIYGRDTVNTNYFEVYNNTFYGFTTSSSRGDVALYGATGGYSVTGNLLKNNLWEGNYFSSGKNTGFATIDTNGFYANTNSVPSGTTGQVNGGATAFTDAGNADFSLAGGSYAVGVGLDLSSIFTTDITGATRTTWDLGAYADGSAGNPDPGDGSVLTAGNAPVASRPLFR